MKKWFAPVTFVQIKDTKEKHATASAYMLVCKPGNQLNSRQYNTAHKWGEFFRFYMFLIKVLNNVGRLYPFIRKNFKELPRKQNDTTSVL